MAGFAFMDQQSLSGCRAFFERPRYFGVDPGNSVRIARRVRQFLPIVQPHMLEYGLLIGLPQLIAVLAGQRISLAPRIDFMLHRERKIRLSQSSVPSRAL